MAISTSEIKQLRDATGVGMMDAKRALEEADGDQVKALEVLRKKGQAKAEKRAERTADAGLVDSYVHMGRVAAMVEVNCETDFVARTDDFKDFVRDVAMQVAAANPQYLKPDSVPESVVAKEKEIYTGELEGKPENIREQILSGKLDKFYEQACLYKQPFIKDPDKTIEAYQTELVARLGENIVIAQFARMELGVHES
ncbi:MAG: translation elongation factor Ts [Candidatus Saccharimonadales bacterium]